MTCPHRDHIHFCPLYVGMHIPNGPSCWADRMEERGCAVDQGADYETMLAGFRAHHPRIAAECEFAKDEWESREQRKRNMRAAGIQ